MRYRKVFTGTKAAQGARTGSNVTNQNMTNGRSKYRILLNHSDNSRMFESLRQQSYENITSEAGILLRMNRSIQVEGAFGVIKQDMAFRRFLTRGKQKTETQFFLIAIAFNIQKLWNRQRDSRIGLKLFKTEAA